MPKAKKLWVPFDSYTMNEAIRDRFILNPIKNIVPVASKMLFDKPSNELEGFEESNYKDADKKANLRRTGTDRRDRPIHR